MSKKYVIDLPDDAQYILINGASENHCYTRMEQVDDLEELNSDYINEHYGELQDEAYQAGLNDAWKAVKKIALMDTETSENVTGYFGLFRIMENLTPMQAIEKLKAYEDKHSDRSEVGDIVDVYGKIGVVTYAYKNTFNVMMYDGSTGIWRREDLKKTGKHYDIQSILEAMRE